MEAYIIWIITLVVILGIFIPYFISFRKKQKQDLERKREAENIGIGRPRSQFPLIDNAACIGCGSCVEACPEGDVLGVVFGKATIINGERCVGHGYCELACPVGALKVGLGDIKTRDDIPLMDKFNETTVKGLFIAGELGGISLIRNAISQGRMVVERIASLLEETRIRTKGNFDIIIVGGGPAGLSAALSAIDKELSYIVLDQQEPGGTILQYPRKKLVMTQPVEIPLYGTLDKSEYSKEHLLNTWHEITKKYNLNINVEGQVQKVEKTADGFAVTTSRRSYTSSFVVLAMGRRGTPRKLCVPGEDQSKVLYQLVDAQSYNNNDILVVGGGDSAVEAAVGLARQEKNRVTISYRKPKFFRMKKKNEDRINDMIKGKKILPLFNSNVIEIRGKSVLIQVDGDIKEIPNDYVFVFAGGIPPFDMLKAMGIKFGGEVKKLSETCTV
jgi:thioredoxin reductase (NADPH)